MTTKVRKMQDALAAASRALELLEARGAVDELISCALDYANREDEARVHVHLTPRGAAALLLEHDRTRRPEDGIASEYVFLYSRRGLVEFCWLVTPAEYEALEQLAEAEDRAASSPSGYGMAGVDAARAKLAQVSEETLETWQRVLSAFERRPDPPPPAAWVDSLEFNRLAFK